MTKTTNNRGQLFYAARSAQLSERLEQFIPGGVDSPFRSFKEVGGHTLFFERAKGSRLYDVDGNEYIDYLGAWGPAILGHCHPRVSEAVKDAIEHSPVFGAPHEFELQLAELLCSTIKSLEMVRFVNSGTEAVMSALRLARGYTGRDLVLMFEGCYHGHSDPVLASWGHCSSAGVPKSSAELTAMVPFNDINALENFMTEHGSTLAAVLIEPIAGSMGVVPPEPGFLQAVQNYAKKYGAVFILDEVLTGFRVAYGGAQSLFDLSPDLSCFGKGLAGGMPIGAYGGKREIMLNLEPVGKVYQAGTFSGNPATMAGGIATLRLLQNRDIYERMESLTKRLFNGVEPLFREVDIPVQLQRVGSMFAIIFAASPIRNFQDSLKVDSSRFADFYHQLLRHGLYFPPSAVDACALSAAHTVEDVDLSIERIARALKNI